MCEFSDMLIQAGRQEGRREGRQEGKLEGQRETKRLTALNLANMGMAVDFIARAINESTDLVTDWLHKNSAVNS